MSNKHIANIQNLAKTNINRIFSLTAVIIMTVSVIFTIPYIAPIQATAAQPACSLTPAKWNAGGIDGDLTGNYTFKSGGNVIITNTGDYSQQYPQYTISGESLTINRKSLAVSPKNVTNLSITPNQSERVFGIGGITSAEAQKVEFFSNNDKIFITSPALTGTNPQVIGDTVTQGPTAGGIIAGAGFEWKLPATIDQITITSQGATDDINMYLVSPCNEPPTAIDDAYIVNLNSLIYINPLNKDSDPKDELLVIKSINNVDLIANVLQTIPVPNGTVIKEANGLIRFEPGSVGSSVFPYVIRDINGGTATANETITINPTSNTQSEPFVCDRMYGLTNAGNADPKLLNKIQVIKNDSTKGPILTTLPTGAVAIEVDKNTDKLFYVTSASATPALTLFYFDPATSTHTNTGQSFTVTPLTYTLPLDGGATFTSKPNQIQALGITQTGKGYGIDMSGKLYSFLTVPPYTVSSTPIQIQDNPNNPILLSNMMISDLAVTNSGNLLLLAWSLGTPGGNKNTPYFFRVNDPSAPQATLRGKIGTVSYDDPYLGFAFGGNNNLYASDSLGNLLKIDPKTLDTQIFKTDNVGVVNLSSCVYPPFIRKLESTKSVANLTRPADPITKPGDELEYTIKVMNKGDIIIGGAELSDQIPNGVDYVLNSTTLNGNPKADVTGIMPYVQSRQINSPNQVSGSLAVDTTPNINDHEALVKFKVKVKNPIPSGVYNISNQAFVIADSNTKGISDDTSKPGSEGPTISILDLKTDLTVKKSVSNLTPNRGESITYTVQAINQGGADAVDVKVSDVIPSGLEFVSANTSIGGYDLFTGEWFIGLLKAGETRTLEIQVTLKSVDVKVNNAKITTSTIDTNPNNNEAQVTITPNISDLEITSTVSNVRPNVNDNVTFEILIKNKGKDKATNVLAFVTPPVNTSIISEVFSKGTKTAGSTSDEWSIDEIAVNEVIKVTYVSKIISGNKATVTGKIIGGDVFDNNNLNNDTTSEINPLQADLQLTKSAPNSTPNVGDIVQWSVTIDNKGPDESKNIEVTDNFPAGLTYISHTLPAGFNSTYTVTGANGTGVWKIPSLISATVDSNQSTKTLRITGKVVSPLKSTNNVIITKNDTFDPFLPNNRASASVTPRRADLQLVKTVDNPTPQFNGNVIFEIKLTNLGIDTASNVEITDKLPAGLAFISYSSTDGIYNSVNGLWSGISTLVKDGTATLKIVAKVEKVGQITNIATISRVDTYDDNPNNNTGSVVVGAQSADVALTKVVSNSNPDLYSTVDYSITVKNNGPSVSKNISVIDKLPAGLELVSFSSPDKTGVNYDSTTGTWTGIGDLAVLQSIKLNYKVKVVGQVEAITNQAVVKSDTQDSNTNNNQDSVTINPKFADIGVVKIADKPKPFLGEEVVYTITVSNKGKDTATGVIAVDPMPSGLEYLSSQTANGIYDLAAGTWTLDSPIAKGETAVLTIRVKVKTANIVRNKVKVTSGLVDPNLVDNESEVPIDPIDNQLKMFKTVDNATPDVNSNITYTLTAQNLGEDEINNVIIKDKLPTGLEFVSSNSPDYNAGVGEWNAGTILGKTSKSIQIVAKVTDFKNIVTNCADAGTIPGDPNQTDNKACVDLKAIATNLVVTKIAKTPNVNIGSNGTFVIKVTNEGPAVAKNVVLEDPIPTGAQFVSSSQVNYDPITGKWNIGNMPPGDAVILELTYKINASTPVNNTVKVKTDTIELNYEDNQATATITPVGADLSVDKKSDNPNPNLGSEYTYTITVKNSGPSKATNVKVDEILPTGTEYISHLPSKGLWDKAVWFIGDMDNGSEATLTIKVKMISKTAVTNKVKVSSDTFDQNLTNNTSETSNDPVYADLAVVKTVDNASPAAGGIVKYSIVFTNLGKNTANNVVIEDILPSGATILNSTTDRGTVSVDKKQVTIPTLNPNQSGKWILEVQLSRDTTSIDNTAVIKSDTPDPDLTNNKSNVIVNPVAADLGVVKTVTNDRPNVYGEFDYTINVINNGPNDATNVILTDVISSDLDYLGTTTDLNPDASNSYDPLSRTLTIKLTKLVKQGTFKATIKAKVKSFVTKIDNSVNVKSDQVDLNLSNNNSTVSIAPRYTVLNLSKTVDNAKPQVGQEFNYTVKLVVSEQTASNVVITDIFPFDVELIDAIPSNGNYNKLTNTWTLGDIQVGSYTLTLKAKAQTSQTRKNTVSVTSNTPQKNPETDKSVDIDPNGKPDAIDDTGKTQPGMPIVMKIVEGNNVGINPPQMDNSVKDTDPDGDDLTITNIDGKAVNVGDTITLSDGSKVKLDTLKKVIVFPSNPLQTTPIVFPYTIIDGNEGSDTATVTVTMIPYEADMKAIKTVSNPNPQVGQEVEFTLTAVNLGPDKAYDVIAIDKLPTNFKFVSASGATYDPVTGEAKLGNIDNGAQVIFKIKAIALDEKPSTNTLTVTTKSIDKDPTNNKSEVPLDPNAKPDAKDDEGVTKPNAPISMNLVKANPNPSLKPFQLDNSVADTDPDGDDLKITQINGQPILPGVTITLPSGDKVTLNIDGKSVTVTPINPLKTDDIKFNYTVDDGKGGTDTANVVVKLSPLSADLKVTKTVDNASPKPKDIVKFFLKVENLGPDVAINVIVNDKLPAGLEYVSINSPYVYNDGEIKVGEIASGSFITIELLAKVVTNLPITNIVTVKSDTPDPDPKNNRDEKTVDPDSATVVLTKKANNTKPRLNDIVTYTITATNTGPDTAKAVQVIESLPAGLEFQPNTNPSYNPTTGVWSVGDILINEVKTLVLTAKVTKTGPILNTVVSKTPTYDPDPKPPVDETVTPNADPIAKDDYGTTDPGSTLEMQILENGPKTFDLNGLSDQSVKDSDPDRDAIKVTEIDGKAIVGGGTVTLSDGTKVELTVANKVKVTPKDTTSVYKITFPYKICDVQSDGKCGGSASANVVIDMLDAKDDTYNIGYNQPKVLDIFTNDSSTKGGIKLTSIDGKPITPGMIIKVPGGTIDVDTMTFKPDGTNVKMIEFTYTTTDASGNLATAKVVIKINNDAPLALDDTAKTKPTDSIVMALVNGGDNVVKQNKQVDNSIADKDPEGQKLEIVEINGQPVSVGVKVILPSGDEVTLNADKLTVTVKAKTGTDTDTIKFTYTIKDPSDNKATANATVIMIPLEADIELSKSVNNSKPQVGETVEYTVSVKNLGPDTSEGVIVNDKLPDGLEYVSDDSNGAYNKTTGVWTVGDMIKDSVKTLKMSAKVLVAKTIINIASVTTKTPDPIPNPPVEVPIYPNTAPLAKDDVGITYPNMPIEMKVVDGGSADANSQGQFDNSVKDVDPDGDALVAVKIEATNVTGDQEVVLANGAKVKLMSDKKTLMITAPNATTTKDFAFKYQVSDSKGGFVWANVRVKILINPNPDIDVTDINTPIKMDIVANDVATDPVIKSMGGTKVVKPNKDGTLPDGDKDEDPTKLPVECQGKTGIALVVCKLKYFIFGNVQGVQANAADVMIAANPIGNTVKVANGSVTYNADGTVTITPDKDYFGVIEFPYELSDSDGDVKVTSVKITIPEDIADLDHTKSVNNPKPQVGDMVEFTLTVINRGPKTAKEVYIEDKLPAGLEYVSDDSAGKYDKVTGKWTIGDMVNGASVKLVIKAKAMISEKIVNISNLFTKTQDPTPNTPKKAEVDPNGKPDAIDDLGQTKPLKPITMQLIDGGKGKIDEASIDNSVMDTDPDKDPLIITNINGVAVVAGTIIKLNAYTTVTLNADLKTVTVVTSDPDKVEDIKFPYTISDGNGGSDTANVVVKLNPLSADLSIVKSVEPTSNHMINDIVDYKIIVTNAGVDDAFNVEVEDVMPSSLAFISTNNPDYNPTTGKLLLPKLTKMSTVTLLIKAKIIEAGTITNMATVKSTTPDPDPKNNKSSTTITPGKPTPRTGGANEVMVTLLIIGLISSMWITRFDRD